MSAEISPCFAGRGCQSGLVTVVEVLSLLKNVKMAELNEEQGDE